MYTISIRNMTQVNSTEIIIYSDEAVDTAFKIESANIQMEEGRAGSLNMKVPVGNVGYDYFEELSTQVIVRKDTVTNNPDKVYWIGRLLSVKLDFNNSKELVFEGIFNYLMDTIQLPSKSTCSLSEWVTFLLDNHNAVCTASGEIYKKVYKGTFDSLIDQTSHELFTNYETTQEMVENAIEYDEAHVFFRYVYDSTNGCYNLYLDFKKNYDSSGDLPVISFGQNLMDYSRTYEVDELATVIIPRGERYSDNEWTTATTGTNPTEDSNVPAELDHYRTVWSCATTSDHTLHDYRVYTTDTVNLNKFGYVCKTIDFNEIRDPNTLLQLAQNYLANQKWIKLTIEISAFDMKLLSPDLNINDISIGKMIHCISLPHGLNYYYPCTGISEDILDITGSTYTLGTGDVKYLTDAQRNIDDKLKDLVRKNIDRENILTQNILNKPTNAFTNIWESIDAVEQESEEGILTVRTEAKSNVLNILNVFDSDLNRNNKGYVHFITEERDYSIDEGVLTLADLKARVNTYFPDTTTSGSYKLSDFWTHLETYMDDENYMVVVLLGSNLYETAIGIFGYTQGTVDGHKVPYYNTPSDTRYTSPAKYFVNGNSSNYYLTRGGFKSKSGSSCRFSCATSGQFFYSSNTSICNKASPAISSMNNTIPGDILPNDLTFSSNNYTVYCNRDIYTNNLQSIWRNKNFYKSLTPNPKDHITEIVISDKLDYLANDANVWRWNKTGLYCLTGGYYATHQEDFIQNPEQDGYQNANDTLRLALTADGNIVANRITAGVLNADVIRAGVIRSRQAGATTDDDNLAIDIPNGNILAKKGTLIFNSMRTISVTAEGIITLPTNEFIYISNKNCTNSNDDPVLMSVSGLAKADWRIVSGDSFGVDSAGRVYMREGIIGATGGIYSVEARNITYCTDIYNSNLGYYVWNIKFNTDASRPLMSTTGTEVTTYRFRMAHYDANNDYVFVTKLFSFEFEPGTDPVIYQDMPFYPTITPDQEYTPPFANGELFPIFYYLNDSATEDYYEQDGHRYSIYTGQTVVATATNPNKYTTYSGVRNSISGTNAGAVNIGSGYLSNGTFGQDQSFYLGGLKRSGTVAENTRTDWRFSVGSKFGVTETGNVYCTDMYARGAYLDRCTVNGRITVTSVTNLNLTSSNLIDAGSETCTIRWAANLNPTSRGDGMFEEETDFYMYIDENSELSAPPVSPKFKFTFIMPEYETSGHGGADKPVGTIEFTYNKNQASTSTPQSKLVDTRTWDDPDTGYLPSVEDGYVVLNVMVEMLTEETSSFKYIGATQLKTYPSQDTAGSDPYTYVEGYITVARVNSTPRPAVSCSVDFIGGSTKWLGGPRIPWGKVYCGELIDDVSGSSSSILYKEDVSILDSKYDDLFDRLRPVKYKFKKNRLDDNKFHTGFIMEDIGNSMKDLGINEEDFAAYNPDYENGGGSLRYNEFIALTVSQVQKLKIRINKLEQLLYEQGIIDDTDD